MSKSLQLLAGLVLCLAGASASAYHLDDHASITVQAYKEFAACFPDKAMLISVDELVQADLNEDLNLLEKLFMYSHFFNPNKELHMWRLGSAERVASLEPSLQQCRVPAAQWTGFPTSDFGHVIHHLQDMTVPAHVVPVHHSAWDGFEVYEFKGSVASGWSCAEIAASGGADLTDVLKVTARDTLAAVGNLRIKSVRARNRVVRIFEGSDFWMESKGDGFGEYGKLGNFFGNSNFVTRDGSVEIPEAAFHDFKGQQMQAGVRSTLRALAWAFPQP